MGSDRNYTAMHTETWVLSRRLLDRLEHFHARCARYIAHRHIRHLPDNTWEYPPTLEILDACSLSTIQKVYCKTQDHSSEPLCTVS